MNEQNEFAAPSSNIPPTFRVAPAPIRGPQRPLSYWLKRLFVCNPFYLASAALLLYGVYRISCDPNFLATESGQLTFNFASLQLYEGLLAGTALLLVGRKIYYDATLLVVLENLLWIVPFILVSQAALINQGVTARLCLLAAALAVGRAVLLRWRSGELMPAWSALGGGAAVVTLNTALPILFRHYQETKMGTGITDGPAYELNEASWFWLLPALVLLANLLPHPDTEKRVLAVRRWFPMTLFLFWLLGTVVHLYCLGYVYDFNLRAEQLAPALVLLAWTLRSRLTDFLAQPPEWLRCAFLILPLPAMLIAVGTAGSHVPFALSLWNFIGYAVVLWRERGNRWALQLAMVSLATMASAVPAELILPLWGGFDREKLIGLAGISYVLGATALSRNPKLAILGSIGAAVAGGLVRTGHDDWLNWAAQAGFAYFLLHSLRWQDHKQAGAAGGRTFVAVLWVLHALVWGHEGAKFLQPFAFSGVVLCGWWLRGIVFQIWRPQVIPVAAGMVMLGQPLNTVAQHTQAAPAGVLAVVGSFVLFAVGTAAALTKHRWHKGERH